MSSIRIEGDAELRRAIRLLGARAKAVRKEAIEAAAEPMVEAMVANAPRDTGALELGIGTQVSVTPEVARVKIGPKRNVFYGMFQELGTQHHGAQPFMRPAFDQEKDEAVRAFGEVIRNALVGL